MKFSTEKTFEIFSFFSYILFYSDCMYVFFKFIVLFIIF